MPLCKVARFNGQSISVLFHQAETLFDPCLAEMQGVQVTVRSHGNRRAIPSHSVAAASAGCRDAGRKDGLMVAENSNSNIEDDKSSYEHPVTREGTCSKITIPV